MNDISAASPCHVRYQSGETANVVAWGTDSDGNLYAVVIHGEMFRREYNSFTGPVFVDGPAPKAEA